MDCTDRHDSGGCKYPNYLVVRRPENDSYVNQKALYFPDIVGKSLATGERLHTTDMCAGRVSVISMLSTKISEVPITYVLTLPTHAERSTSTIPRVSFYQLIVVLEPIRFTSSSKSTFRKISSSLFSSPSSPPPFVPPFLNTSTLLISCQARTWSMRENQWVW